jgi:uncharacterized protein (UPF0128 family)
MAAKIEWLLEEVDGNEIVNVDHAETYAQVVSWQEAGKDYSVGLVRDLPSGGRSWAYIEDGKLPAYFMDAYGEETAKVPAKYHREIA